MAKETSDKSEEAFAKAEARIRDALKTGVTELHLRGLGLAELPESLGQLTQLQELDLSHNELTSVSESLGQFSQLRKLYLSDNQLTSVPASRSCPDLSWRCGGHSTLNPTHS